MSSGDSELELARQELALLQNERERLEAELVERDGELLQRRQELERLRARTARDGHTISSLDASLNAANRRLRRVEGSVTWQLFERVRERVFALLGGEQSRTVSSLQATLRSIGRRLHGTRVIAGQAGRAADRPRRRRGGPIELPEFPDPIVSIVIPLYAHAELTRAALHSIREHTEHIEYEVILVDDCRRQRHEGPAGHCHGAPGYSSTKRTSATRAASRRGAGAARGRWLVLGTTTSRSSRDGWRRCWTAASPRRTWRSSRPSTLRPTGASLEAGGVIWRDGTGCNYGRGEDASSWHYEYRREIDYGSAAALLVRTDFWNDAGGFDERFEPMYYEDTDLCFQARARGLRVMYEPTARRLHFEGSTAGVDESAGHKRHQETTGRSSSTSGGTSSNPSICRRAASPGSGATLRSRVASS